MDVRAAMKADFQFWLYVRDQEHSGATLEVLGHPKLRAFGDDLVWLQGAAEEGLSQRIRKWPGRDLPRFRFFERSELIATRITLPQIYQGVRVPEDTRLTLRAVLSRAEKRPLWRVWVPPLDLALFFKRRKDVTRELPREILKALQRRDALTDLRTLALDLAAPGETRLETITLREEVPSLKAFLAANAKKKPKTTPEIDEVSDRLETLVEDRPHRCHERAAQVARLREALEADRPKSVLLVGPRGVGKTEIIYEWARVKPGQLRAAATTGSRIVAGMSALGDLEERCRRIMDEARREKVILAAGSLLELLQAGRHQGSNLGVSAYLKEAIARRELTVILEATAEEALSCEEDDPGFLGLLERIDVDVPSAGEMRRILRGVAEERGGRDGVPVAAEALEQARSLHARFEPYASLPGRCVRFLLDLIADDPRSRARAGLKKKKRRRRPPLKGEPIDAARVSGAFSKQTGLPLWLLQDESELRFEDVAARLRKRLIGQDPAVDLVARLVCRVKAGLAEKEKPLMSLFFVGPTGVGKTEMAKALADFVFSDDARLLRFDMSEYSNPAAVSRLTGALGPDEGELTKRLRETPFSVVLFDEIEKADPGFFDLLLQILGDGRLTDAKGRVGSFRHAVVIMTSNLGAVASRQGGLGFAEASLGGDEHYRAAVEDHFRPELLNRIDAVVPFDALSEEVIRAITDREVERFLRRDGLVRNELSVAMDEATRGWLASIGFDPAMGARPLKRAIEDRLALPVADALCRRTRLKGRSLTIAREAGRLKVELGPAPASGDERRRPLAELARRASDQRRTLWLIEEGRKVTAMRNRFFILNRNRERYQKRLARGRSAGVFPHQEAQELARIEGWLERFRGVMRDTEELEEVAIHALLSAEGAEAAEDLDPIYEAQRLANRSCLLTLLGFAARRPDRAFLSVRGGAWAIELAEAYAGLALLRGFKVKVFERHSWEASPDEGELRPRTRFIKTRSVASVGAVEPARQGLLCVGLELRGEHAYAMFSGEGGVHDRSDGKRNSAASLIVLDSKPADEDERAWSSGAGGERRSFDARQGLVKDRVVGAHRAYTRSSLGRVIGELLDENLDRRLLKELR